MKAVVKFHKLVFFLLIFLLPVNLAKHFIFSWSYTGGILVDYSVPAIYVTDILIWVLLFLWVVDLILRNKSLKLTFHRMLEKPFYNMVVMVLALFCFSLAFSVTNPSGLYKYLKILEMFALALYVSKNFSFKRDFAKLVYLLSGAAALESILSILQFLNKGSVFSSYLVFGEQPYSSQTPGIIYRALNGQLYIPPFGTFPHPNVLAGFLSAVLLFQAYFLLQKRGKDFFVVVSVLLELVSLFLIRSLTADLALFLGILCLISLEIYPKLLKLWFLLITILNLLAFLIFGSLSASLNPSIFRRTDLLKASFNMITSHPFGVGLNTFAENLYSYGGVRGVILFVQPVHNIFYLLLSESGIVSFALFIFALYLLVNRLSLIRGSDTPVIGSAFAALLFLGTFDHYLFTIQQGMLLFWLTLGLMLSTINLDAKVTHQPKT